MRMRLGFGLVWSGLVWFGLVWSRALEPWDWQPAGWALAITYASRPTLAACGSLVGQGGPEGLGTGESWFWYPGAKARTGRIVVHTRVESRGYKIQEVVAAYMKLVREIRP